MTLLYRLDASAAAVSARFGARAGDDPWAGGYAAPGKFAPVITAGREFIAGPRPAGKPLQPRMVPRLWGVLPPPSADDPARLVASVRNPDSPFWIGNLRNSEFRCLVPATAFMEWGSGTDYEGRRLRHWFAPDDQPMFAMAGVWKDNEVPGFALLTRGAAGVPKELGCKAMPVVLPDSEEARQIWLHGGWDSARRLVDAPAQLSLRNVSDEGHKAGQT
uniref:SOS response-associated peptidase family protein n=1 Tax=Parerythrobacter lutipelagi TaxID=1964208 RepID=UPI001F00440E|nr:SOS response-associated peptidase family protein [Parerythrobacter lutipelagi]